MSQKYKEAKKEAIEEVKCAKSVSLSADTWTSINTEAFLAVTCHFITSQTQLKSVLLGVLNFPEQHTAKNIAEKVISLKQEWELEGKITCIVTDGAANMIACGRELQLRHTICIAHRINTMVKKSIEQSDLLSQLRSNARRIVAYFKSSSCAKVSYAEVFNCLLI